MLAFNIYVLLFVVVASVCTYITYSSMRCHLIYVLLFVVVVAFVCTLPHKIYHTYNTKCSTILKTTEKRRTPRTRNTRTSTPPRTIMCSEEPKDKTSVSEKESIVFLVDCAKTNRLPISKNYFYYGDDTDDENNNEGEQTQKSSNYVQVALNAYRNVLRDRVVCTPDDEIGLVFYNTKNRSGELEFDNILDLPRVGADYRGKSRRDCKLHR